MDETALNNEELAKLRDEVIICTNCGLCKVVCPIFEENRREPFSTRAKMILAYFLLSGQIELDDTVVSRIYQCTTCKNCTYTCLCELDVAKIIEKLRKYLVERGHATKVSSELVANIEKTHNPFGEDPKVRNILLKFVQEED
jgi:Fe-S oxidoreductase